MISFVFVDRPRLAIVIAIIMTLAGALAMLRIPVAQFPDIVPPQVQVTTRYPGASASVVEATVAQPLEAQVNGADRMIYMKSNSGNDGSYGLTVSFELGTNPDINTVNVNNRVQAALSRLPQEVQRQGITVQKRSSAILEFLSFSSEGAKQSPLFISNYVTINVLDRLSRVPGVGSASLFGALDYSMRIWLDTARLVSLNLSPNDIITAIQQQNVQAPVGRVGGRPTSNDTQFQINLQTKGRLTSPEEFGNIVLRANPDGSLLRVHDVARVELGAATQDSESRLNSNPAVTVGVYLAPGANAVQTSQRVQDALNELQTRFPEGLKSTVFYNSSSFVSDTIEEVIHTLAEAFVLVVLVVFIFLGNFRATLIPTFAVPVSLIGTFAVLLVIGYSANTVSLLALVLAIGIVVDDAIVVVENVERVMEEEPHLTPKQATKKAMGQITAPIIAITLVLLSVFVPIGFIPGISGTLFRQFAVTISVAMLVSAINALTLSPALCGVFLRPHHGPRRGIMGRIGRGIDWARDGYANIVARLIRFSVISLVLVGASVAGIFALSLKTPTGFLPDEDQGAFFVAVQLPDAASVTRTREVVQRIEGIARDIPQIQNVLGIVGFSLLDGSNQSNAAFMVMRLKPFADRAAVTDKVQAVIGRMFGQLQQIRSASAFPFKPAANHRPVDLGRLRVPATESRRRRPGRHGRRAEWPARRRQRRPGARPRVQHLQRHDPDHLPRHRPRKGTGARPVDQQRVHRAAGDAGRHLRQRLQPVRPHLAGQHPGRGRRQDRYPVDLADPGCATTRARWCPCAASPRPASCWGRRPSAATTTTAPSASTARRSRACPRVPGWPRWPPSARTCCRLGMPMNGPARPTRRSQPRARLLTSSGWRCCSPIYSWSPSTRVG